MFRFLLFFVVFFFNINLYGQNTELNRKIIFQKDAIIVYQYSEPVDSLKAILTLKHLLTKSISRQFLAVFSIENYELSHRNINVTQSPSSLSDSGNFIDIKIGNDKNYELNNTSLISVVDSGSHLFLAYLSRSNKTGIKYPSAYIFRQFDMIKKTKKYHLNDPYLFYSRPSGTIVGSENQEVLLDFYLLNVDLSHEGYKVKVILDNYYTFYIYQWSFHTIRGLTAGTHSISLSLLNKDNKVVKMPSESNNIKFIVKHTP